MCIQAVETGGPAYEAGLRAGDIISHVNGTAVQGLLHIQVVSLILSGGTVVRIQATPLSGTTIKVGRRPRTSSFGRATGASRIPRIGHVKVKICRIKVKVSHVVAEVGQDRSREGQGHSRKGQSHVKVA